MTLHSTSTSIWSGLSGSLGLRCGSDTVDEGLVGGVEDELNLHGAFCIGDKVVARLGEKGVIISLVSTAGEYQ